MKNIFNTQEIEEIVNLISEGSEDIRILQNKCEDESCCSGIETLLKEKDIKNYNITLADNTQDLCEVANESYDAIVSCSTLSNLKELFSKDDSIIQITKLFKDASRVLKENKPLIFISENHKLVFTKKAENEFGFNIRFYTISEITKPFFELFNFLLPIKSVEYIDELVSKGFTIKKLKDTKNDTDRNLMIFKKFLEKGKEFAPESWLVSTGYEFIEPNSFTKMYRIAYKLINDFPDERYNSIFSLMKDDVENVLYLEQEMPEL